MTNSHMEQEKTLRYMAAQPKDQSSGRLLLAMVGLSVVVPLLMVSVYLLVTHAAASDLAPPTFGLIVLFVWLIRRAFRAFRERLPEESESVMNFAQLGVLTCICRESEPRDLVRGERRQTCRACGHAIVARELARLEVALSGREISNMQLKLRHAAVKSKNMEIPSNIENVDQLIEYLKSSPSSPPNDPPKGSRARQFA